MVGGLCRLASSCPISPPTSLLFDSILPFSFNFFFFFFDGQEKERGVQGRQQGRDVGVFLECFSFQVLSLHHGLSKSRE